METVSNICALIVGISMFVTPVLFLTWAVKKLRKKPAKKMGIATLIGVVCFVVFLFAGTYTDPATYCDHEYKMVDGETATCEKDGYEKYHCDLCGRDKTEKLKKLGHDMVEIRRAEPTYEVDGEFVRQCSRCGYEEIEVLKKLGKTAEADKNNHEGSDENNVTAGSKDASSSADIIVDGETIYGFYDVIDSVGIDKVDTKYIKKTDDWRLGPCYKFPTEGTTARVNCNMDGTINHLEVGNGIILYQQGYEPWNIADFIVNEDVKLTITMMAEDAVKQHLNYPATADFPWLDWTYGRRFNQYTVKSSVTAKNGFGVESEMPFSAGFWVEADTAKLIYLEVDGAVVKNELEQYPIPERAEIPFEVQQPADGSIRIYDGQLGEYGKKVQLDSYEYDWYMVPAGKYEAVSNVKTCTVYVDKNEITRNSDGYVELENVATYTWGYGETIIIEVGEDEHLFNVYGADYTLTLIAE